MVGMVASGARTDAPDKPEPAAAAGPSTGSRQRRAGIVVDATVAGSVASQAPIRISGRSRLPDGTWCLPGPIRQTGPTRKPQSIEPLARNTFLFPLTSAS